MDSIRQWLLPVEKPWFEDGDTKMKQFWRDKSIWILLLAIIILVVFLVAVGFRVDQKGFGGNLLAEIVGILIGIVVTLFVVDEYVKWRRKHQWAKVSSTTYMGLAMGLGRIFSEAIFSFEVEYGDEDNVILDQLLNPVNKTAESMENIISRMRKKEESVLTGDKEDVEDRAIMYFNNLENFHNRIQPVVDRIRSLIIPRLLQYSEDHLLIEKIVVFEQITTFGFDTIDQVSIMMKEGVALDIQHRTFGTWVSTFLNSAKDVYLELRKEWSPEQL